MASRRLVVMHSTGEAEATLRSVRLALAVIALLTALASIVASYALARTITRPLSDLTASMREMARTGTVTPTTVARAHRTPGTTRTSACSQARSTR